MTKQYQGVSSSLLDAANTVLLSRLEASSEFPGGVGNLDVPGHVTVDGDRILMEAVFADIAAADLAAALDAQGVSWRDKDGAPLLQITEIETAAGTTRTYLGGYYPAEAIIGLTSLLEDAGGKGSFVSALPVAFTTNVGATTSQGDQAQQSDDARTNFGVDGTGITVGVLSDSFAAEIGASGAATDTTVADDIASGDLPNNVNVLEDGAPISSDGDEGRAMLQIVHDVAPGASLAFHTANGGQANFADGISRLRNEANSDVIVDDIIYFAEPFFQDGIIAQAAQSVVDDGAVFLSSAGNNGDDGFFDTFRDSGVDGDTITAISNVVGTGLGNLHDWNPDAGVFSPFVELTLPTGNDFTISFQWDEPYAAAGGAGSTADFDIYITELDSLGNETLVDNGFTNNINGDPIELVEASNSSGSDVTYRIYITEFDPSNQVSDNIIAGVFFSTAGGFLTENFNPQVLANSSGTTTTAAPQFDGPTAFGHSNAEDALAVGASAYFFTPEFGVDPARLNQFSSKGGFDVFFDDSGNRLASTDFRDGVDFVAPDGANTTFFGSDADGDAFPNFFGTSAAAPHAAGVVALMLDRNDTLTPAQVETFLEQSAAANPITLDNVGRAVGSDFVGAGFIDANAALGLFSSNSAELPSLVVTTTADVVDNEDGETSLREAIGYINDGTLTGTITFAAGVGEAFENGGEIDLTTGNTLTITRDVTIDGDTDNDGTADVVITGDVNNDDAKVQITGGPLLSDPKFNTNDSDNIRVLEITDGSVTLDGVVITGGRASTDAGGLWVDNSAGTVTVENSFLGGNESGTGGGALGVAGGSTVVLNATDIAENVSDNGGGAGVSSAGTLSISGGLIFSNQASNGNGGGISASGMTTLEGVLVSGNQAANGGGIYNSGTLIATSDTSLFEVRSNAASSEGGGLFNAGAGAVTITNGSVNTNGSTSHGGGIRNAGQLTLTNTAVSNNTTTASQNGDGGGIYSDGSSIVTLLSGTTLSGNTADRNGGAVALEGTAQLYVSGSTLDDNGAGNDGGGVRIGVGAAASIYGASSVTNNTARDGAGILNYQGGLSISDATIAGNTASRYGGGLYNRATTQNVDIVRTEFTGNTSANGGAIAVSTNSSLTTYVDRSTFDGNSATGGSGGGAIAGIAGTLEVTNSLFTDNTAPAGPGGGIYNAAYSDLRLANSTFSGNVASGDGGGVFHSSGNGDANTASIVNSTFYANIGTNGGGIAANDDVVDILNSSFSGNYASGSGGGVFVATQATASVGNSLVAGNGAGVSGADLGGNGGAVALDGANILGTAPAGFASYDASGDIILGQGNVYTIGDVFQLVGTAAGTGQVSGLLRNNPSSVPTLNLNQSGIAIDAGDDTALPADTNDLDENTNTAETLPVDTRGEVRIVGGASDIGAFEDQFPGNQAPAAILDTVTTDENSISTILVVTNDSDPEADSIEVVALDTTGTLGLVTLNPDGSVTYDPGTIGDSLDDGEFFIDGFSYDLVDDRGGLSSADVEISVFGNSDSGINGGEGNDTIVGGETNELFRGNDGNDLLEGQGGSDTLVGGQGADLIRGGNGGDFLIGDQFASDEVTIPPASADGAAPVFAASEELIAATAVIPAVIRPAQDGAIPTEGEDDFLL